MKLDNHDLPSNLYWVDEFEHLPLAQSAERAVSGALVIETAPLFFGQKITLTGDWVGRPELLALRALQASAGTARTLTLNDGITTHAVVFDVEAGAVEATLLAPELNPTDETLYELTLHFLTVPPEPEEP